MSLSPLTGYPFLMDRNIKVIGEKEERVRALLKQTEKDVKNRAFTYYGITKPLYRHLFFAHMEKDGTLGSYIDRDEIIVLSEKLLDYPISTVRNVLIHECAHAVDCIYNGVSTGHSPFFREAAENLGIEKGFEKAKVKVEISEKIKAREKLDKLMAMTSSSFENEAFIALTKARELIEKAALEDDGKEDKEEKIYRVDVYEKKRICSYVSYISFIVSDSTGTFFVKNHTGEAVVLTAYGSLEQCESSLYLFDYLMSALDDEIARLRKQGKSVSRDSFMIGAYDAIRKKTQSVDTSLVKSIKQETEQKARRLAFKDSNLTTSHNSVRVDKASFDSGSSFGRDLDLSGNMQKRINK